MGLRINTNIAAMNAYRNLSMTEQQMNTSLERLSSGYRINKAADDAAGLAISEGLRSQIGGLQVAGRNTQDAINVVQTADGALNETTSILQRMRDLSVQAANSGSMDAGAEQNIQTEMDQLKSELTRISKTTQFNGTNLLDGSYKGVFQVGANAGETITVSISSSMDAAGLGVDGLDVTKVAPDASTAVVTQADSASNTEAEVKVTAGTNSDVFNGSVTWNGKTVDLRNYDFSQTGAADQLAKDLGMSAGDVVFTSGGGTAAGTLDIKVAGGSDYTNYNASFTQESGATYAISKLDDAIDKVSTTRANLGAYQNRFEHTINNINVAVENLSASESAIRDTDMASEMVNFTRTQILSQAGTAMLAQANQIPQGVLKLLQ